jgi:hypothetical protein
VVQKPQAAPAAAATTPAPPTLTQLLEEPTFELTQQAQAGNTQAAQLLAQLLAQQQANNALTSPAAATGATPGVAGINVLA